MAHEARGVRQGFRPSELADLAREMKRHGQEFREGRITTQSIHDKISRGERIDRLFSDQDRSGSVEGIGRIGAVARIVVDGMIAAVVAVGGMITE